MPFTRENYQTVYDLALRVFLSELREHNRPDIVQRILSESSDRRETVIFTETMSSMVGIMDLCQDVIGQQSDHPARYFPSLNHKRRGRAGAPCR